MQINYDTIFEEIKNFLNSKKLCRFDDDINLVQHPTEIAMEFTLSNGFFEGQSSFYIQHHNLHNPYAYAVSRQERDASFMSDVRYTRFDLKKDARDIAQHLVIEAYNNLNKAQNLKQVTKARSLSL